MVSLAGRRTELIVASVLAGLVPLAAHAERTRMPVSEVNVDLPPAWSVSMVKQLGGLPTQYLHWQRGDDSTNAVLVHDPLATDCTAATYLQAGDKPFGRDWLPPGWKGKADAEQLHTVCTDRPGLPIMLVGSFEEKYRPALLELMRAFDNAWKTPPALAPFEVIQLPRSKFKLAMPRGLVPYETDAEADHVRLRGPNGAAELEVWRTTSSCESANVRHFDTDSMGDQAPGPEDTLRPSGGPAPTGWKRFDVGTKGRFAYCSTLPGPTAIVVSPGEAAIRATGAPDRTTELLAALADWIPTVTASATKTTLSGTSATLHLLDGWKAAENNGVDVLVSSTNQLVAVTRSGQGCSTFTTDATKPAFNPVWIPVGWKARVDTSSSSLQACTDVLGGMLLVMAPIDRMPPPRELVAILDSLRGIALPTASSIAAPSSPTPTPEPTTVATATPELNPTPATTDVEKRSGPRGPLLPFPFHLAYQTVAGRPVEAPAGTPVERGHGVRLRLVKTVGADGVALQLRGELAYDTVTKLGHDLQGRLVYNLFRNLDFLGAVGHDAWGTTEDMPLLEGGLYGGVGASVGLPIGERSMSFEALHLWRGGDVNETRLSLLLGFHLGPLDGVLGEMRLTGDMTTILVGSTIRL